MEKTKKNSNPMESEKMSEKDYELIEKRRVWGWENAMSVANDLWASIHS